MTKQTERVPRPEEVLEAQEDLTREQHEELRRLMRRSDELANAYTTIEDVPESQIEEDVRRRILALPEFP